MMPINVKGPNSWILHQNIADQLPKEEILSAEQELQGQVKHVSPYQSMKAMKPIFENADVDILAPEFIMKYEDQNRISQPFQLLKENGIVKQDNTQSLSYKYRKYQQQKQEDFKQEIHNWYLSPKPQPKEKKNCCYIF